MAVDSKDFLEAHLHGKRFEGGNIPALVLRDLTLLQEVVIEVAKVCYLQDHSERKRLPKGFMHNIELNFRPPEEGSAKAKMDLVFTPSEVKLDFTDIDIPYKEYAERAAEVTLDILDLNNRPEIISNLSQGCFWRLRQIGQSINADEWFEFRTSKRSEPISLNRDKYNRLVQSFPKSDTVIQETMLRGSIPEADQMKRTFEISLTDGKKIAGIPFEAHHRNVVLDSFNGYDRNAKAVVRARAKYRHGALVGIEAIEEINPDDPLAVASQLDDLRRMRDGWLDGEGVAPSHTGLSWLSERFGQYYFEGLPRPYIYPTLEGGVQAEWTLGSREISLTVDFSSRNGEWSWVDIETGSNAEQDFDLDSPASWLSLCNELQQWVRDAE